MGAGREGLGGEEEEDDYEVAGQEGRQAKSGQGLDSMAETESDTDGVLAVRGEEELNGGVVLSRHEILPLRTGVQQYEVISPRNNLS